MEPLKITAHIAGSIAISRPEDISLDGILAYQILRRHFGEEFYFLPNPQEVLYFASLPLEMRGAPDAHIRKMCTGDVWMNSGQGIIDDSLWYWSCSSAQISVKGRDVQYWNKRFDTQASLSDHIDFGGRVEKILIEQGRYKSYHMPLSTLVCDSVVWYAYGDKEKIETLLSGVAGIGKKRSQGHGSVMSVAVEAIDHDYSEWRNGQLMRPIPGPLFGDRSRPMDIQYIAYRAPQWHSANQAMCVVRSERHR